MMADKELLADQRFIAQQLSTTASMVSGKNEHGLANRLWALESKIRKCMDLGHRYIRCDVRLDNDDHCASHDFHHNTDCPRAD